jgi:hypothetical protein
MDAEFDGYGADITLRDCPDGQTTWESGTGGGRVACFIDELGVDYIAWTDENLNILGYTESILVGPRRLHRWWLADSGPV